MFYLSDSVVFIKFSPTSRIRFGMNLKNMSLKHSYWVAWLKFSRASTTKLEMVSSSNSCSKSVLCPNMIRDWIRIGTRVTSPATTWCWFYLMRRSHFSSFFLIKKLMHSNDFVFSWLIRLSSVCKPVIAITLLLFGEFGIWTPKAKTLTKMHESSGHMTK